MAPESSEMAMVPTTVPVNEDGEARTVLRLLEALDEHDDVQNVWSNFDIPDEVWRPRPRSELVAASLRTGARVHLRWPGSG